MRPAPLPARLLCLLASASLACAADPVPEPATQSGTPHRFLCADYIAGRVALVEKDGSVTWSHPAPSCNDVWALPGGTFLFGTGHGVKEVDLSGKTLFEYTSKSEIYACQRLANGNTFIGECNAGRLLEVDPKGAVVWELRLLPEGADGGHGFIRNARRLPNGNILVSHYGKGAVREYDPAGKVVLDVPVPGGVHSCTRLPDGHTLIAVADLNPGQQSPRVIEVDAAGKTVWEITSKDIGIELFFMTGLQRLPNGNTVITNWLGHGNFGKAPHVIEVTRDKRVAWTYADHKAFRTISSIQVLDVPGDPLKGEVLH